MSINRSLFMTLVVYTCLIIGAVVFAFPFLWMVCSSIKVDRELMRKRLVIFPETPNAPQLSPYLDLSLQDDDPLPERVKELLPQIQQAIQNSGFDFNSLAIGAVDPQNALDVATQYVAQKLNNMTPISFWETQETTFTIELNKLVTPQLISEVFDTVYRRMAIGQLRIRAYNDDRISAGEQELGAGQTMLNRFRNVTPDVLKLAEGVDHGTSCVLVNYDFTKGNYWQIEQTFSTNFDLSQLHRIRLQIKPDNTWHRLYCDIEKLGTLYKSERPVNISGQDWVTLTWQERSIEDGATKIKNWIYLNPNSSGPQYESDPYRLKVRFRLEQSSPLQAWIGKLSANYYMTLSQIPVWRYLKTSIYLVLLNVILTLFSNSLVAYAIARLRWPGRDAYFVLMLATMMIPAQVTLIPGFLIWKSLGCYDTLIPLWLGAAFASPFYIFLLRQFLKGIPRDLEDAALIDGCSYYRIYWNLMLPLMKPTLAVIAVWTFMGAWNNFMGALIFIMDQRLYPLAYGLYAYSIQVAGNPSLTLAGACIMTAPVVAIFFFCQRYFIEGVTLTGVKG